MRLLIAISPAEDLIRGTKRSNGRFCDPANGSDLSPIAAEYGSISACSTQNKAKRANKIVFLLLIRDQEVDGSNPFAPTTSLESATYKMRKSIERLVHGQDVTG